MKAASTARLLDVLGGGVVKAMLSDGASDEVLKAARLVVESAAEKSNQPADSWVQDYADARAARPTYDPRELLSGVRRHPRLRACVNVIVAATCGLGFDIRSRAPGEEEEPGGLDEETREEAARLTGWWLSCNPDVGWGQTQQALGYDLVCTGNAYLEVRRALVEDAFTPPTPKLRDELSDFVDVPLGAPVSLYHAMSYTMRVLGTGDGYMQRRLVAGKEQKCFFKRFGDPRVMNKGTGEFQTKDGPVVAFADRASEIIHFRLYDPENEYYGAPSHLPTSNAQALAYTSLLRLVNQVTRAPGWPYVMMTHGIGKDGFLPFAGAIHSQNKGLESAGRPLLANAPRTAAAQGGGSATVQPLGNALLEAESLLGILERTDGSMREAWPLPELYLGGAAAATRSGAMAHKQIGNELVFGPMAALIDERIDATVMLALGAQRTRYVSRRPRLTDPVQESQILARQGKGVLSADAAIGQINRLIPDARLRRHGGRIGSMPQFLVEKVVASVLKERESTEANEGKSLDMVLDEVRTAVEDALGDLKS